MKSTRIIAGVSAVIMSLSAMAVSASAFDYPDIKTYNPTTDKYQSDLVVDDNVAYLPVRGRIDITPTEVNKYYRDKTGMYTLKQVRSAVKVSLKSTELVYNGKEKKPSVAVRYGTQLLKKGRDYTVAYSNNVAPGTATVTITGIGAFTGTYTTDFYIVPKKVNIKIKNYKSNDNAKVFWTPDTLADGYEVQLTTDRNFQKYIRSYNISNSAVGQLNTFFMRPDTNYYVRVRAYIVGADGKRHYGNWSAEARHRRHGCKCTCWKVTK